MSKRAQTHHAFGRLHLVCPDGHRIGWVLKQPTGGYHASPELIRIDGPDGTTKLKARCRKCEENDVHRDLQASWEHNLMPKLDELEKDPTRAATSLTIGG